MFFYALILALPFNITWAHFTETSFYYGYHAFYNTIFISLTDFIVCGLVLTWLYESYVSWKRNSPAETLFHKLYTAISPARLRLGKVQAGGQDILIQSTVVFWLILAISTFVSRETWISFYGLWKISEFLLLFLYVRHVVNVNRSTTVVSQKSPPPLSSPLKGEEFPSLEGRGWGRVKSVSRETILGLILIGAVIQSGIGIFQYLNQYSLGLQRFGETFFAPGMKGIAEFYTHSLVSVKHLRFDEIMTGVNETFPVIRAYGTFPHSNVLAAFLFLGLLANIALIYAKSRQGWDNVSVKYPSVSHFRETFLAVSLIVISTGLTLTFSRTVWAVTAFTLIMLFAASRFHRNKVFARMQAAARETGAGDYHPRRIAWILILLFISLGLNWVLFGQQIKDRIHLRLTSPLKGEEIKTDESVSDRQLYNSVAWKMIKDRPIAGSGLRTVVSRMDQYTTDRLLPHLHQPVHNIYLLLWVETGILGLAGFLWVIGNIIVVRGNSGNRGVEKLILLAVFGGFLLLGFFDHYFFSLNQGGLMFWIVAGLVANRGKD